MGAAVASARGVHGGRCARSWLRASRAWAAWVAAVLVLPALAVAAAPPAVPVDPECIAAAARHHRVPVPVLQAIAWHESRGDAAAVGRNTDGSIDIGAFQVNSIHLPELAQHGIDARHLADPCLGAYVAAWHLARQMKALGPTWAAVGAYHSRTPARQRWYANRIAELLMSWRVVPPGPLPYPEATTLAPRAVSAPAAPTR